MKFGFTVSLAAATTAAYSGPHYKIADGAAMFWPPAIFPEGRLFY